MNRRIDGDGSHEFFPLPGQKAEVEFELTPDQLATVQKAAAIEGMTVEDFIRYVLEREMGKSLDGLRNGHHDF